MAGDKGVSRTILCAVGAIALIAAASPAQPDRSLAALSRLEPGLWQIREIGSNAAPLSICVADPALLMQVRHRESPCSRLVIANDASGAIVNYTCPANGFGRTTLRYETPRLAKIDTQGIIDNTPFAFRAEARHLGPCAKAAAGR